MKKLSKQDMAERDELLAELDEAKAKVEEYQTEANEKIDEANGAIANLNGAVADFNSIGQALQEWAESIASRIEEYIDEKSERWQESDAASSYAEFRDEYQNFAPTELDEVAEVEQVDMDIPDLADEIGNLPEEVSL